MSAIGALFFLIGGIYRMIPRQFECTFLIVYKSELHFQRKTMKDMQHMNIFLAAMSELYYSPSTRM